MKKNYEILAHKISFVIKNGTATEAKLIASMSKFFVTSENFILNSKQHKQKVIKSNLLMLLKEREFLIFYRTTEINIIHTKKGR